MDLPVSPEEYASRRARYRSSGVREDGVESDMNTSAMRDEESSGQSPLDGVRRTLHSDPLDD